MIHYIIKSLTELCSIAQQRGDSAVSIVLSSLLYLSKTCLPREAVKHDLVLFRTITKEGFLIRHVNAHPMSFRVYCLGTRCFLDTSLPTAIMFPKQQ